MSTTEENIKMIENSILKSLTFTSDCPIRKVGFTLMHLHIFSKVHPHAIKHNVQKS